MYNEFHNLKYVGLNCVGVDGRITNRIAYMCFMALKVSGLEAVDWRTVCRRIQLVRIIQFLDF